MSDEQLLQERFLEFYQQNYPRLISFAAGQATHDYPTEDLLQDAFEKAWRRLDPANCNYWGSWFCRIIINLRIDRHWKRKEAPIDPTDHFATTENAVLIADEASETPSPSELAEYSDIEQTVRQAVASMKNEQQRRVLELLLDNRTLEQVAAAMNISYGNAKKIYQRGRNALRETTSLRQLAKEMNIPTERPSHEP